MTKYNLLCLREGKDDDCIFSKHTEDKNWAWVQRVVSTCKQKWQISQKLAPRRVLVKTVGRGERREEEDRFWKESISSCISRLSPQYLQTALTISDPGSQQTSQEILERGQVGEKQKENHSSALPQGKKENMAPVAWGCA